MGAKGAQHSMSKICPFCTPTLSFKPTLTLTPIPTLSLVLTLPLPLAPDLTRTLSLELSFGNTFERLPRTVKDKVTLVCARKTADALY